MSSLFPTAAARAAQGNALVQFPAGKCILTQQPTGRYQVTADTRRGQIQLTKGTDGILHFKWVNLSNGTVEDDRMVFGNDCKFKKVKTGRENDPKDRVYMLKFNGESKPLMLWLQNPSSSNDDELVKQVNKYLENPTAADGPANSFGTLSPNLMQLLGQRGSIPPAAPAAAPSSSTSNAPAAFGNLDLSSLLANMNAPAQPVRPATQLPPRTPALQDVITGEDIVRSGILNDPEVEAELVPLLPPGQQTSEHLQTTLRSAQLQQSLGSLTGALRNSDNFQSVMSNFQLNPADGHSQMIRGDGVGAFLNAIQAAADRETSERNNNSNSSNNDNQTNSEGNNEEDRSMNE
jgi:hypothetical protein